MTIRELFFSLGYKVDKNSESKANASINSLKNAASKVLGAVGIAVSVSGIASAITDCVNLSSEVEEMQNKFDVVFQGMTEDVEQWAQSYADSIGRNSADIKTYLADTQNLLVGMGMQRAEAAELDKQMVTLALDLASFNNLDSDVAVDAMTKALMGETEAAKTLGAVLNDNTRAQAMNTLGLQGSFDALDEATKMQVNYQAILNQSKDAIGDCERSMGSYQSTLRTFQSKLKELKIIIGQFFMPMFQKVLNFGTKGIVALRNIVQRINEFAQKVGGAEKILAVFAAALAATLAVMNAGKIAAIAQGFSKVAKALGMTALKAVALFAVFLILALVIQDFIAFMSGDNSVIGTLFDRAGIGAENARQTIINAWEAIKTFLQNTWETIKSLAQTIWGSLTEWWAENGESIMNSLNTIWEGIKTLLGVLWEAISSRAKQIFEDLKSFWDTWGATIIEVFSIIWNTLIALIEPFIAAIAGIIDFLANVFTGNWQGAWNAVLNICSAVWQMILAVISGVWNSIVAIWSGLASWFGSIWEAAKSAVVEKITQIKDAIVNGFNAAIEWIKSLPAQAYQWGADIINSIANGIRGAIGAVGDAVSGVANKIKSFLHFSEPDEGPLSNFHTYMPDMIDLMARGIRSGKEKVGKALTALTGDMSVIAQNNVVSPGTVVNAGGGSGVSRSVTQNVNIQNTFNGDRAGQKKSADAMDKASGDATQQMARAIAFL